MSPSTASAGGPDFTLMVNGGNFISSSVVNWNGSPRTTSFVNGNQLTASIAAGDIATAGPAQVTVFNPGPGGGSSSALTFTINNNIPAPTISSLSPDSATAGGPGFNLTVNGGNFISSSVVNWNGSPRTTSFVSGSQLTASIPAGDIAMAGTAQVTVFSPGPGGGTSNTSTFTINNPAPTISSLSPNSATAGGPGFTLTVNGGNFISTSVVNWNGSPRTTSFVNGGQLTASIPAGDIATAGTAQVTVFSPAPGGGTSSGSTFTINNLPPAVSSLSPVCTTVGGPDFTLTVNGSSFVSTSVVKWNSSPRTTGFVSGGQLTASILASDIATAGTAQVSVSNPAPGGGTSSSLTVYVNGPGQSICPLNLVSADVIYDSGRQLLYASVPASAPSSANSITPIDPVAGTFRASVLVGNDPGPLAISGDGQFLYMGLNQAPEVHRLILSSSTLDPIFISLGSDPTLGPRYAENLKVVVETSRSVAVSRRFSGHSPRNAGVAVFDDATKRPNETPAGSSPNLIQLCSCSALVFGLNVEDTSSPPFSPFYKLDLDANGLTVRAGYPLRDLIKGSDFRFSLDTGGERIYSTSGQVIVPTGTPSLLHTFPVSGLVTPDAGVGRVFFLTQNPPPSATTWTIRAFDTSTFSDVPIGTLEIPGVNGNAGSFIRWGTNGLAFRTDSGQVFLITTSLVAP